MPLIPIITWLLGNKWLWWLGAAAIVVALYFGWRSKQRGIGAAKIIEQLQEQGAKRKAAMQNAPKVNTDDEMDRTLRDGRG